MDGLNAGTVLLICAIVLVVFSVIVWICSRYKKCPSDKIMVIYGSVGKNKDGTTRSAKCIHGGAAFVIPVFQSYEFLDLTPLSIQVDLKSALSRQNIRIDVPSRFTVGISTEPGVMQNAAERLLGLQLSEIQELSKDIIFGQLRLIIATMDIEEINTDRDKFLAAVSSNVETELKKIGLRLINVNVTDISDESGYIAALGKEAAAKAINDAKRSVAERERDGSIGEANSVAIQGENEAKMKIAMSDAELKEKQAEALKIATTAEKIQAAKALEESYSAERAAEEARRTKEQATLEADIIVRTEAKKRQMELEAEAEAEQKRRIAKGEADAIYAKMEAEARGAEEILKKQAAGFAEIVKSAGGDTEAALKLLIADKLEELMRVQVEAIKNIKIDKVTVWDNGQGSDGKSATAGFLSGMMKSVPPLQEVFAMAGMELPEILGKKLPENTGAAAAADADGDESKNDISSHSSIKKQE